MKIESIELTFLISNKMCLWQYYQSNSEFLKKVTLVLAMTFTNDLDLGTKVKVLPQRIQMWNMTAPSLTIQM